MKKTENSQKQVLIIGSGTMCEDDCRIHEKWIHKYNIFNQVAFHSATKKGKSANWITLKAIDHCGTRTIYQYFEDGIFKRLHLNIYNDLGLYLWNNLFNPSTNNTPIHLFLSQTDPGLGIVLPQDKRENGFSYRQVDPIKRIYELSRKKEKMNQVFNNDLFGEDILGYSL